MYWNWFDFICVIYFPLLGSCGLISLFPVFPARAVDKPVGRCTRKHEQKFTQCQRYDCDSGGHDFACNHWPQWKHLL